MHVWISIHSTRYESDAHYEACPSAFKQIGLQSFPTLAKSLMANREHFKLTYFDLNLFGHYCTCLRDRLIDIPHCSEDVISFSIYNLRS